MDNELEMAIRRFLEARSESLPGITETTERKKFLRALQDKCSDGMLKTKVNEVEVDGVILRVIHEAVPAVDEGGAVPLMQWALENDLADSLLSCRVKAKVWRKMLDSGIEVPGVSVVSRSRLEVLGG